ncbi:MAG: hypothetical protein DME05_08010 [Candidatus Rokuibacteriota bacterium]|nr:MAG: hypothetical protein DME05_08010 [Candidatus Rokubacteria bacterium]
MARIIVGAYDADDGKGVAGVIGIQRGDAHQVGTEVARHLLDVARSDFGGVELSLGREDVALGRVPDQLQDRVGLVGRRSVDEGVPVGIVAPPRGASPRALEPAGAQRH